MFPPNGTSSRRRSRPRTQCRKGAGRYKNESTAGTRNLSDQVIEVAGSMDDAHDLDAVVDDAIENEIGAIWKRTQIGRNSGRARPMRGLRPRATNFPVSRSMNRSALVGLSSAM